MDKREQTRKVRQTADTVERERYTLALLAEADLSAAELGDINTVAGRAERAAKLAARNAVELATGGTPTCKRHADRAVAARNAAVDLAATVRRAVEAERLRRAEAAHAKRTMLERDYPALAAVVACAPSDTYFLDTAVALVRADDYRAVARAMDTFGPSKCWTGVTLPDSAAVTPFITEDTDARELAGVIRAYVERAEACILADLPGPMYGTSWETPAPGNPAAVALDEILAAAHAAGWRAPGVAFDGTDLDVETGELANDYAVAVWGGDDDDHAVAEAATLAVARYGVLDDDHRPDDHAEPWEAWIVPGVPVWLPHVEAWRRDMPTHDETLTLRQMDRAERDWKDWGHDTYRWAYGNAYREAILDAETPPTVGEEWDSGVSPEGRADEAEERAEKIADELDVSLGDLSFDSLAPTEDEVIARAEKDARDDYRLTVAREVGPANTVPLF